MKQLRANPAADLYNDNHYHYAIMIARLREYVNHFFIFSRLFPGKTCQLFFEQTLLFDQTVNYLK